MNKLKNENSLYDRHSRTPVHLFKSHDGSLVYYSPLWPLRAAAAASFPEMVSKGFANLEQ
jgi:hypothetical protein